MKALLPVILDRLKQPSSIQGLAVILALVTGHTIDNSVVDAVSILVTAGIGAFMIGTDEKRK